MLKINWIVYLDLQNKLSLNHKASIARLLGLNVNTVDIAIAKILGVLISKSTNRNNV